MKKQLKQAKNQSQSGRSMVEMLGVLAIIGVLSIGGIAGYRMAMNRYQANQIANEINLMRTDAKMKVARGVDELLLGSPYDDEKHLNFGSNYGIEVAYPVIISDEEGEEGGEKGYSFTLSNIPKGVCKPLVTLLDGMDDTAALEINGGDYATAETPCDNEENEVVVAFSTKDIGGVSGGSGNPEPPEEQGDEPQDEPVCDDETCAGGTCNAEGVCECNDPNEYWTGYGCTACPAGARQEDGTCKCTEEGSHLKGSACITCPEEAPWSDAADDCVCKETGKSWSSDGKCIENVCNSGTGCPDDEYCDMNLRDCSGGNPVPYSSGHTCKKAEGNYTTVEVENSAGGKKTIYVSNETMDWWTADGFCRALGKRLVSLEEDLGCTYANDCKAGSYGKALKAKLKLSGYYGWTSTLNPSNSCSAYRVYLYAGGVNYGGYRSLGNSALCE